MADLLRLGGDGVKGQLWAGALALSLVRILCSTGRNQAGGRLLVEAVEGLQRRRGQRLQLSPPEGEETAGVRDQMETHPFLGQAVLVGVHPQRSGSSRRTAKAAGQLTQRGPAGPARKLRDGDDI